MTDDLNNKGVEERQKISLNEEWEITYWTGLLGCTKEELHEAATLMVILPR